MADQELEVLAVGRLDNALERAEEGRGEAHAVQSDRENRDEDNTHNGLDNLAVVVWLDDDHRIGGSEGAVGGRHGSDENSAWSHRTDDAVEGAHSNPEEDLRGLEQLQQEVCGMSGDKAAQDCGRVSNPATLDSNLLAFLVRTHALGAAG